MEVVGGVASALQLANVALQSLIKIYGVAWDMKEAPKRLREVLVDLENFVHLLKSLESEATQPSSRFTKAPERQTQSLIASLQSTATCADGVRTSLAKILPSSTDSVVKRTWRTFASLSQEKDVITQCDRLHRLKQDVQLHLQNIGISLIDLANSSLDEIKTWNAAASQVQVLTSLDVVATRIAAVEQSNSRIEELAQTLHRMVLSKDMAGQDAEPRSLQCNNNLASVTEPTHAEIKTAVIRCCRQLASYPTDLAEAVCSPRCGSLEKSEDLLRSGKHYDTTAADFPLEGLCSCAKNKKTSTRFLGPFKLISTHVTIHDDTCTVFSPIKARRSVLLNVNLTPFIQRTVELMFQASSGSGGLSVSQSLKSHNTVRRRNSPAFQLFDHLYGFERNLIGGRGTGTSGERSDAYHTHLLYPEPMPRGSLNTPAIATATDDEFTSILKTVCAELEHIFTSGSARPTDVDEFGNTLMHELAVTWRWLNHRTSEKPRYQLQTVATYLYNKGVSLTSTTRANKEYYRTEGGQHNGPWVSFYTDVSAIDLAYSALFDQRNLELLGETRMVPSQLQIPIPYNIISEASVEIDWRFVDGGFFLTRTERLQRRSCLLELATSPMSRDVVLNGTPETNLTPLHYAVFQRSMERVVLLMKTYPPEQEEWSHRTHVFSVVESALGWKEGLKLLCVAGYHVTYALEIAIFRKDLDVLKVLLEDSNLYRQASILNMTLCQECPRCRSGTSIWPNQDIQNEVFDMVIHNLQSRRRQLRELAYTNLPKSVFQSLGLDDLESVYLDAHAYTAFRLLNDYETGVSPSLRPSYYPIFHSFNILCPTGGVRLADRLYKAGFRQVDAPSNSFPKTPLQDLVSEIFYKRNVIPWCDSEVPAMNWLIDHGAEMGGLFGDGRKPLLHELAKCYDGPYYPLHWDWTNDPSLVCLEGHPAPGQKTSQQQRPHLDERSFQIRRKLLRTIFRKRTRLNDGCNCFCSESGCLPEHRLPILFKPPTRESYWFGEQMKSWNEIQVDLFSWMLDVGLLDSDQQLPPFEAETQLHIREYVRREIFERLGMAHTCCRYNRQTIRECIDPVTEETRQELQAEDAEAKEQLDVFMQAFAVYIMSPRFSSSSIRDIWRSWWDVVDAILPPLLPWERGMRYAKCNEEIPASLSNKLHERSAERHRSALERAGYPSNMNFIDIVRNYLGKWLGGSNVDAGGTEV